MIYIIRIYKKYKVWYLPNGICLVLYFIAKWAIIGNTGKNKIIVLFSKKNKAINEIINIKPKKYSGNLCLFECLLYKDKLRLAKELPTTKSIKGILWFWKLKPSISDIRNALIK